MDVRRVLAIAVGLLVLAGCSGGGTAAEPSASPATSTARTPLRYVALGDSYTSGPSIPQQMPASFLCLRSDHNYPHLLAERLGATSFVDVSCAGATTASVRSSQAASVDSDTDLVTLGIGGNDANLFATMLRTCARVAQDDVGGAPCENALGAGTADALDAIGANVESTLRDLQGRAPSARLVLVGYPRILPDTGTCRAVPFAAGDYAWARTVEEGLDDSLAHAAAATGVSFVSVREASRGHDACAGDRAWVNGAVSDPSRALAFHPFAVGMQGVANLLAHQLPPRERAVPR